MWLWLIPCLAVAGCVRDGLVPCGDGRSCPVGTLCDDVHATCVTADQLATCAGAADATPCETGAIVGECSDEVCFESVCGNGIEQSGEECDDGNDAVADGCTPACLAERCGNGRIDPATSEACDDGNLRSGDGCDSRCIAETFAFHIRQCGRPGLYQSNTVYDVARSRIVSFDPYVISEGNDATWTCNEYGIGFPFIDMVYDPDRQRIVGLTMSGRVDEWDGTSWTNRAPFGSIGGQVRTFAYDTRAKAIAGYSSDGKVYYWDGTAGSWSNVTGTGNAPPLTVSAHTAVFDHQADRLMILVDIASPGQATFLWNRATQQWSAGGAYPYEQGSAFVYNPTLGRVMAYGVDTAGPTGRLHTFSANAWASAGSTPMARTGATLLFDAARGQLVLGGGAEQGLAEGDVWRQEAAGWMKYVQPSVLPRDVTDLAQFPSAGTAVAVTDAGETWTWSGTGWSTVGAPFTATWTKLAYDEKRGRVFGYDESGWFASFDGQAWTVLATDRLGEYADVMVYNPESDQLLLPIGQEVYARGPNSWVPHTLPMANYVTSAAFDRRAHRVVGVYDDDMFELLPDLTNWVRQFIFPNPPSGNAEYVVAEFPPHGSVLYVGRLDGATWERSGESWTRSMVRPPHRVDWLAYDAKAGELLAIDTWDRGRVYGLGYTSATPRETCAPTGDLDGDGAAGCADPDCWWTCTPTCPPFSSCE